MCCFCFSFSLKNLNHDVLGTHQTLILVLFHVWEQKHIWSGEVVFSFQSQSRIWARFPHQRVWRHPAEIKTLQHILYSASSWTSHYCVCMRLLCCNWFYCRLEVVWVSRTAGPPLIATFTASLTFKSFRTDRSLSHLTIKRPSNLKVSHLEKLNSKRDFFTDLHPISLWAGKAWFTLQQDVRR